MARRCVVAAVPGIVIVKGWKKVGYGLMTHDLLHRRRQLEVMRTAFDGRNRSFGDLSGAAGAAGDARAAVADLAPDVGESWRRCAARVPVDNTAPVSTDDADARWSASPIRRAAPDVVDELGRLATSEDYIAAVTDGAGQIIWSAAGKSMARLAEQVNFVRGAYWDEAAAGTNAPGLVLQTGRPAAVFATEHWCEAVQDWVCYAAPVRSPSGLVVGVLDLSAVWRRASPLALTTVKAMARLVEQQLIANPWAACQDLRISVLGHPSADLHGQSVRLSQRQFEILTILCVRKQACLEELHDLMYGERPVSVSTLKAEISHLRQVLDGAIDSRPYRLTLNVDADVVGALEAVRLGDLDGALRLYRGQLLPFSESPFVIDLRHHLDAVVRSAVLSHGGAVQLLQFADIHPFDVEVLERGCSITTPGDPLHDDLTARLARAQD